MHCFITTRVVSIPPNDEERKHISQEFYSITKFLRYIGAIDCRHIRLRFSGENNSEIYRNKKGWFSINVEKISDVKMRIWNILHGGPVVGPIHVSTIFRNSSVKMKFDNNEFEDYLLVGDSEYAVMSTKLHFRNKLYMTSL